MEQQPFKLTFNGESFELNHRNSVLITYISELAIHNHLRLYAEEDEGMLFQDEEGFNEAAVYMIDAELPLALNLPEVTDRVVEEHAKRNRGDDDIEVELEKWKTQFEA